VNLLDLCAVTVPTGPRTDGLVGSATVIGPAFADAAVAGFAAVLTGETPVPTAVPTAPVPSPAPTPVAARGAEPAPVHLAVIGAHLTGMALNGELTDLGARFVAAVRTAPAYRLHALPTEPPRPGMVRDVGAGAAIEAEVWSLDSAAFGAFVAAVPHPLCIGTVELQDGSWVKGFLCEPEALERAPDITATGSWRRWLAADD
jgi:allophanate hydrolase